MAGLAIEEYRRWAVTFAQTLADGGLVPAVYSPMKAAPHRTRRMDGARRVGYGAIEGYLEAALSSQSQRPTGYSARGHTREMRSHFEAQGVAVERCVLVERCSADPAGTAGGRGAARLTDWLTVIAARIAGARTAGFTLHRKLRVGFNRMQAPDADNVATATAYIGATQSPL